MHEDGTRKYLTTEGHPHQPELSFVGTEMLYNQLRSQNAGLTIMPTHELPFAFYLQSEVVAARQ